MKVLVAVDSFKGSMTSMEVGGAVKQGILNSMPDANVIVKGLADGGEGTTDALIQGMGGEKIHIEVTGPLQNKVLASYGYIRETGTAIIEMAEAAGITLMMNKEGEKATTYGVGEMIKDAISRGCRHFILGIGGSATNDGGVGMLMSLGYKFKAADGSMIPFGALALGQIAEIDDSEVIDELKTCKFQVACDVSNPLCGPNGATYIYGPQKGVTEGNRARIDEAMAHYAACTKEYNQTDFMNYPGAGAAGGMGFALLSYLNADLKPGVDLILNAIHFEEELEGVDLVITGEGKLDSQTINGKAPIGVAKLAKKHGIPTIAIAGGVSPDASVCTQEGIDAYFSILSNVVSIQEAMNHVNAVYNTTVRIEQIFNVIKIGKSLCK